MQYFRLGGPYFAGDCMPFSHAGRFHLLYLLDENHHQGLGGLGGHQWAHASSTNLTDWEHHPLALAITEEDEGSICTGSVFHHAGTYYAFYAKRRRNYHQQLHVARSQDGITFEKDGPPFAIPPEGYSLFDYRDPFVFQTDDGMFHLLVTAKQETYPLHDRGGCLLRLTSPDLETWQVAEPFLFPGGGVGYDSVPECPELFHWNGWYYLLFGLGLKTHYRMARSPLGPWQRPANDTLGNGLLAVMKTAPFGENRRIGVGWIGTRRENRDANPTEWGGNVVFREIVQNADGTLGTAFPPELIPPHGASISPQFTALTPGVTGNSEAFEITAPDRLEVAALDGLPHNCRVRCRVIPGNPIYAFGLGLRGEGEFATFYPLTISPSRQTVRLQNETIDCVEGLNAPFDLDIVLYKDILDVCIGGKRCLINRLGELAGSRLFFYAEEGSVRFENVQIAPL